MTINITVWNEFRHEQTNEAVIAVYPAGIHQTIKAFLKKDEQFNVRTATLDQPDHGLTPDVLDSTDVLIWWGHAAHAEVRDDIVEKVCQRIRGGMGLIVLHSGHFSKVFKRITGANCGLKWRDVGEKCRVWNVKPNHPIAAGVDECIELEHEEMYGEPFGIPDPDELVFMSWFKGGEVFRSGCVFNVERGKVFYFQPGHETYPIYHHEGIQKIISNACKYVAPTAEIIDTNVGNWIKVPLEEV
ncbi:MAG: ThuA domain-containing protein [Clostridia bacterium]|nr:ThuA domain-containing protein [Clostridia bacterium]